MDNKIYLFSELVDFYDDGINVFSNNPIPCYMTEAHKDKDMLGWTNYAEIVTYSIVRKKIEKDLWEKFWKN